VRDFRRDVQLELEAASRPASTTESNWRKSSGGQDAPRLRILVVAKLMKADAEKLEAVRAFREEHLKEGLLDQQGEQEEWLWARSREEARCEGCGREKIRHLGYRDAWDRPQSVSYAANGVLRELAVLAGDLSDRYGWRGEEAATFVLCDRLPFTDEIEVKIVNHEPFGAATRIILTLDAAMSPAEVTKIYTQERGRILGRRYRSLDKKHTMLGLHEAVHGSDSWPEKMHLWNQGHTLLDWDPAWAYANPALFRRDTNAAVKHLLRTGARPTHQLEDATERDE
jgi:hypothetical protein